MRITFEHEQYATVTYAVLHIPVASISSCAV